MTRPGYPQHGGPDRIVESLIWPWIAVIAASALFIYAMWVWG